MNKEQQQHFKAEFKTVVWNKGQKTKSYD